MDMCVTSIPRWVTPTLTQNARRFYLSLSLAEDNNKLNIGEMHFNKKTIKLMLNNLL